MNRFRQRGVTTVEFAIIGLLAMTLLMAVIEFSRLVFAMNALGEATRRGARVAAVCPINDPFIAQTTVFAGGGGSDSPVVSGLATGNVVVEYLNENGGVIGNPGGSFTDIFYVRVRIAGYQHQFVVPVLGGMLTMPELPSTLPRESLGVPRQGVVSPC